MWRCRRKHLHGRCALVQSRGHRANQEGLARDHRNHVPDADRASAGLRHDRYGPPPNPSRTPQPSSNFASLGSRGFALGRRHVGRLRHSLPLREARGLERSADFTGPAARITDGSKHHPPHLIYYEVYVFAKDAKARERFLKKRPRQSFASSPELAFGGPSSFSETKGCFWTYTELRHRASSTANKLLET